MIRKKRFDFTTLLVIVFSFTAIAGFAQVSGNGKVVKEDRKLSGFTKISVGNAIKLVISQGSEEKVIVETDENVLPYLKTDVSDGELRIGIKGSVNNATEMNVYVTVKQLVELETSSAARVESNGTIEAGELKVSSGSGSAVKMAISCKTLKVNSSSGSASVLSGSALFLKVESSSGSALVSKELKAEKGELSASSGAVIVVHISKELKASASSGASITVQGNPAIRDTENSSGGSIHFN